MNSNKVRQQFLDYFSNKKHEVVSSSSLIPDGDSTLIFTNAGMFQFKNVFLGHDKREYSRAVSSQKCVRAGGKHNDLENVGYTARHHTFFEMLGNFSFGDYFKKEAIHYAWDFLTNELKIPKERLYVTVFNDDDEAEKIWIEQEKLPKNRIFRFGEKDNFWRMADTGPCGPCSEIFYDHFPEKEEVTTKEEFEKGGDEDRFIEIWNLVFMQYYEEPKGNLSPLPKPSVDTGMGLERLAAIMQEKHNNYESDLFQDYIDQLQEWTSKDPSKNKDDLIAMRVLADHARCITFLIADGVLPSNDGRGYVLRRIIRRAIRYARSLSKQSLLAKLCNSVVNKMAEAYPDLKQKREVILHTADAEEERFLKTLDQGSQLLEQEMQRLKKEGKKELEGEVVFKLYDTYGFPLDLSQLILREKGFSLDEKGFEKNMEKAKEKARKTWKGSTMASNQAHLLQLAKQYGPSQFLGYEKTINEDKVLTLSDGQKEIKQISKGDTAYLIVKETCFYAESGGQVGDSGSIDGKGFSGHVLDCVKVENCHILQIVIEEGVLKVGDLVNMVVHASNRRAIRANHSATHLLHAALRKVLGRHVTQAGSLVDADRLRFDFTHNKPLEKQELQEIEDLVNHEIAMARDVHSAHKTYDQAIEDGALALFGEKYGDDVRVIQMGDFSTELCGGTHVSNTVEIRMFKIVSEGGVSAGIRRIEALTATNALDYLKKATEENTYLRQELGIKESWLHYLEKKDSLKEAMSQISHLREDLKAANKKLKQMQLEKLDYKALVAKAKTCGDTKYLIYQSDLDDRKILADITEKLKDHLQSGIIVSLGKSGDNHPILVAVTKDLSKKWPAGKILQVLAKELGGKGGGRPELAQGAVERVDNVDGLLEKTLT